MEAHCDKRVARHNKCREVMKCHNHHVDHLSDEQLSCMLKKGVMVDGNKMYWFDAKARMCVEVFARALNISSGSSCKHWNYKFEKLSGGQIIEVAELLEVCYLEVKGHFDPKMLTPCKEYEVLFDIEMKPCATGFCHPVKFSLTTPDGCKIESHKCLNQFKGQGWKHVSIGKFRTPSECEFKSNIEFKMHEVNAEMKRGVIVRGVIIRPAKCGC